MSTIRQILEQPMELLMPQSPISGFSEISDGMSSEVTSDGARSGSGEAREQATPVADQEALEPSSREKPTKLRKEKKKKMKSRPLCLDYVNGKCMRPADSCRYYHPDATEIDKEKFLEVKPGVCGVWVLTGFCKFGENCWNEHPTTSNATMETKITEPVTRKFRSWVRTTQELSKSAEEAKAKHPGDCDAQNTNAVQDTGDETPDDAEVEVTPGPVDQKLPDAIVLLERLKANPQLTIELLSKATMDGTGLCYQELLPLVHNKVLAVGGSGSAYIKLAQLVRQSLQAVEHDAFDQLFYSILKSPISKVCSLDMRSPEQAHVAQLLRGRAVKNLQVLTHALSVGLLQPDQLAEVVSLLSTNVRSLSAEEQDLRVLLLSHLLRDVLHMGCPTWELMRMSCMQLDTESALEKLLQLTNCRSTAHCGLCNQPSCALPCTCEPYM
jgi:hypothetical protein